MAMKKKQAQRKNPRSKSIASTLTGTTTVPQRCPAPVNASGATETAGLTKEEEDEIRDDLNRTQDYLDAATRQAKLDATKLGWRLKQGRLKVFFYAGGGFDWQPLHRFSHQCDCFVYVDPRKTAAEFAEALTEKEGPTLRTKVGNRLEVDLGFRIGPGLQSNYQVSYDEMIKGTGQLAEMANEAWPENPNPGAWGAALRLVRRVGENNRPIWLVFIGGSPLAAYRRLFITTNTAPYCLAIPTPAGGEANPQIEAQWRAYVGFQGQLGRLIQDSDAPLPKLLVADRALNWPTFMPYYRIPHWRNQGQTEVHTLRHRGWRHVTITRNPLDPASARAVGAVVVTRDQFANCRWPDRVLVIINGLEPNGQNVPAGDGVVNCNIVGKPLHEALKLLEEVCAERGITKLAIQGLPGFEDEADDLAAWRQQEGRIKELILHVECDGHFIDYAPVADVID